MNAMRVGKKLFPRCRSFSSGAQFHSESEYSLRQLQERFPEPDVTVGEAVSVVFWAGVFLQSTGWIFRNGRRTYEEWTADYKMQKMLKELDRKKMESSEAYVETIHRKIKALKPFASTRFPLEEWELNKYEREMTVLKSRLNEWTQGMAAPAPAPAPVSSE